LALREGTNFEQACNLLCLPAVHIREEFHTLDGSDGIARRGRGRYFATSFARSHSAALQQIELTILEGPFDIASQAIDLLALKSELAQGGELSVVEAELVDLLRWQLLFEGAAVGERTDGDALATSLALQHLSRSIDPEMVRDDQPGNDGFSEAPAGFN